MRILHTADWHMNRELGWQSLNKDIRCSLEQIANYLEDYKVDVMVVAGDVLEKTTRIEEMKQAIQDIRDVYLPFLKRGGTIVAVSGNHDNEIFFEALRDALDLVSPTQTPTGKVHPTGRLYIAPNARILRLPDPKGNVVQFVLMPYPTPRAYLSGENIHHDTIEKRHRAIYEAFKARLEFLQSGEVIKEFPSVLVSHIHVRGVQPHSLYKITELEDVIFEQHDIPKHWAYIAYGHIHAPQPALPGATNVRYAGSVTKLDASEKDDHKSVVICDIWPNGMRSEPEILPLHTTPMYQVNITDPDTQLPVLAQQYADSSNALVHYTLQWDPSKHDRDILCRNIEQIFPRCYGRSFQEIGDITSQTITFQPQKIQNVVETVREYLDLRLKNNSHRDELIALAEALLAEEVQ